MTADARHWRVIAESERRLRFLDTLSGALREQAEPADLMATAARLLGEHLGASRCAYAQMEADEDHFEIVGDHCRGVPSIVGRYALADFGREVLELNRADEPYVNPDVETHPSTRGTDLTPFRRANIRAVVSVPLHKARRFVAGMAVHQDQPRAWTEDEVELVREVVARCWESLERLRAQAALVAANEQLSQALKAQWALQEQARTERTILETLNRTGADLAAELDLQTLLQRVTDAATQVSGARFGAFFYNAVNDEGRSYQLFTLSGAPLEAFTSFGHPRPTALFGPTFRGEAPIRIADVQADPRYGQSGPHHGMPAGHLPVRSYLATPVIGRGGDVIGALLFGHPQPGVFTEYTERLVVGIAAQAAIAVDNARLFALTQKSAEEKRALLDSERAARVEAEQANRVKDDFLAVLSHELRTPLSAIVGWTHILRRKLQPLAPELLKGVDVIERSVKMQTQLIDDLLDMSRITSGKLHLDLQPVDLAPVVEAAADAVRAAATASNVAIRLDVQAGGGCVVGDAVRLQQVVANLLSNAVKFSAAGSAVHLRLATHGEQVVLEVADQGVGIAKPLLGRIFEPFRQADASTSRRFGGLGLGLSIVRHLVQMHGGAVSADSAGEGAGATFRVLLPRAGNAATGASTAAPSVLTGAQAASELEGMHILVVDDQPDARDMLHRLLEEAGARVLVADGARSALALLCAARPDVLVSDIGMPDVDGYELLHRVRALGPERGGDIPALALTAFARPQDQQRALDAGFLEHLSKPLDPAALIGKLARLRNNLAVRSGGNALHS
jgi:signal transduction histidine kinase/CheY-like chemotaxis protein